MNKPMRAALLLFCMHLCCFAHSGTGIPMIINVSPILPDTVPPVHTILVPPAHPTPATPAHPAAPPLHPPPAPPTPLMIRIFNDAATGDCSNTILEWELQVDGTITQKGTISQLLIAPHHSATFRLPAKIPVTTEEVFLHLRYKTRKKPPLVPVAPTIAEEQLLVRKWSGNDPSIPAAGELSFKDEEGSFIISSPTLLLRFDKQTGWLQHYEVKNTRLLEDTLSLHPYFRPDQLAAGDTSAAAWQQATLAPRLQLFSTSTGSSIVIVRTEYTLPATSCRLHLSYTVNATGEMQIEQSMECDSAQGWALPRFGMQWNIPPGPDSITAYGSNPQPYARSTHDTTTNNNPIIGIYHQTVYAPSSSTRHGDTPANTGIRWWKLTGKDGKGIRITADSSLLTINTSSYTGDGSDTVHPTTNNPGIPPPIRINIDYPLSPLPYGNYHYAWKITPVLP